jgi:hypothetical protein
MTLGQSEDWANGLVDAHGVTHMPGSAEYERLVAYYRASWAVSISSATGERPQAVFPTLKDALVHVKARMDSPGARAVVTRIDKEA